MAGDPGLFVQALLIGLAVAAPVGPMALMCMERTLSRGQRSGLSFGLGVACADASYAALAAFGVAAATDALLFAGAAIRWVGALLMIYFGLSIALAKPVATEARQTTESSLRGFLVAYGLTLTNPPTIVFFAGVFAALGTGRAAASPGPFVFGVLAGSALWWLVLTTAIKFGRHYISDTVRVWINRVAGLAVVAFAVYGLLR